MFSTKPIILFVRHAESEANRILHGSDIVTSFGADTSLTELGRNQAQVTANYLVRQFRNYDPDVKITVWTSPLARTKQTAEPFIIAANDMITEVISIPELQEYTPITKVLSNEMIKDGCINHHSWDSFTQQLLKLSRKLRDKYTTLGLNEHIVIFSHSIVISTLLSYYANREGIMGTQPEKLNPGILFAGLPVGVMGTQPGSPLGVMGTQPGSPLGIMGDINCAIHVPNCSISCLRKQLIDYWDIYTVASIAHLPPALITGIHVPFGNNS